MRNRVLVLLVLAACGGERNRDGISLAEMTKRQCNVLTSELSSTAGQYRRSKPGEYRSYGKDFEARGVVSLQLVERLQFCLAVRRGEPAKLDELSNRIATTREKFSGPDDPLENAAGLDALAAIGREIDALPMRD